MSHWMRLGALLPILVLAGCADVPSGEPGDRAGDTTASEETASVDVQHEFERANELLRQGEYQRGLDVLDKLLRHREARRNAALQINRGIAYEKLGKPDQAEEAFKAALAIEPDHPVANNEYGMMLRHGGRFEEARAAYEKALTTHPEFMPARRNLGILCDLYLGDLDCAMEQYQAYAAAFPEDKAVATWIADLEQKMAKRGAPTP